MIHLVCLIHVRWPYPGLEEALIDRVSFRLFCGFSLEGGTPDETTLCRFRNDCARAGVLEAAFTEVNRQLEAKGLIVKKGTLLDATIVAAASRRPPAQAGAKASVEREAGASFTRKNGKSHFGYRVRVGADEGSGLVRCVTLTPAHVNESSVAEALIRGDEKAVYGDKAYETSAAGPRSRPEALRTGSCTAATRTRRRCPSGRNAATR